MKRKPLTRRLIATTLFAGILVGMAYSCFAEEGSKPRFETAETNAGSWDAKAAANYLDERERWWMGWGDAAREKGTFCVSCHTAVPYAIARPALRKALGEQAPTENERLLLENVRKRVRMWDQIAPTYSDKDAGANKSAESRATEAVLLAFLLANHDAETGKLTEETRAAFSHLWALQQTKGPKQGAWLWQGFDLNPWEGEISAYNGATMAAIAVSVAPENYRAAPEIQNNLVELRKYLNQEAASQPLLNRMMLLWAATKWPGLLPADGQKSIVDEVLKAQKEDGGWSLFPLVKTWRDFGPSAIAGKWKRNDGSLQDLNSDGYATGLAVFVLQRAGVPNQNAALKRGREWLVRNQKARGHWFTSSLNKRRDPESNAGLFMSDAATAYAVLALSE